VIDPISRGIDFCGQVVKPWRRTLRRRVVNEAHARTAAAEDLRTTANSYFGLMRQASHSFGDRRQLARVALSRGHAVDLALTRAFPRPSVKPSARRFP
jgi:hypothetical protein